MTYTFTLKEEVTVHAPTERCFRLSTSLEIVQQVLRMRPVGGPVSGFMGFRDTVRWEGWHLGFPHFHESRVDPFDPAVFFRDGMVKGRFATFEHDHNFIDHGDGTVLMRDELRFSMPFGWLGALAGKWIFVPHIRNLMRKRFLLLKRISENEEWRQYLAPELQAPIFRGI